MNLKVVGDLREYDAKNLPPVLLRVVLEFAGSLINWRHRMHRFLQLEFQMCNLIQKPLGGISPSRLQRFYMHHGFYALQEIIQQAFRRSSNALVITQSMLKIC